MEETKQETTKKEHILTIEGLKKEESQHVTNVHCANRDGDLYYISCPSCDCIDLKAKRIMMCKSCGQHFSLYFEDGHKELLLRDYSSLNDKRIEIGSFEPDSDYFQEWFHICPKIEDVVSKFKHKKTLFRDLQKDGFDGHSHHKYKRYALVPID